MINEPFLLKPYGKDYLWGGIRLKEEFNKQYINVTPLAETWECSVHPDGPSTIASGEFCGTTLKELVEKYPEIIGEHPRKIGQFPILVKFIDAKEDLSIQVHPTDEYANEVENQPFGKTEMWYVIDATEDAELVYGFNIDLTKEEAKKALQNNTFEKYLRRVKVHKDDVFFIPSGQVHAICSGCLIAEIQENSNLTYRLYDYNRTDKSGKQRELHLDKSLDVANLKCSDNPRQPMRVLRFHNGYAKELIGRCRYFQVERVLINTDTIDNYCKENGKILNSEIVYKTDNLSFRAWLCIDGEGKLSFNGKELEFKKGDCIFVPANSCEINIEGMASILDVNC